MARDEQRRYWLRDGLEEAGLDAVVLSLPSNVLMATGYFPVVGTSVALVTREGEIDVLVPEDERHLAENSGADKIVPFHPDSLDKLTTASEAIHKPLSDLIRSVVGEKAIIGSDDAETSEPCSYVAMRLYGSSLHDLAERCAAGFLAAMKARLTPMEIDRVKRSCRIAAIAFERGRGDLRTGLKECEAAARFREPLFTAGTGFEGAQRAAGDVFCMAGANSAEAFGAHARSRAAHLEPSSFALVHCNSHADGYWTDISRTYCLQPANSWHPEWYDVVFKARSAALAAIRPGIKGRDVDAAAREVICAHGYDGLFKHATGHGVGFAAIDGNAHPRIHPKSEDVLAQGMVFNVEPAIYVEGRGGLRHCDMVAVTEKGAELLTPFQCDPEELLVP